jgi:hypothetical protein
MAPTFPSATSSLPFRSASVSWLPTSDFAVCHSCSDQRSTTQMCDYTQVEYACGHQRYTVKAWCVKYQETHKRCPANVIAMSVATFVLFQASNVDKKHREYRLDEKCGTGQSVDQGLGHPFS